VDYLALYVTLKLALVTTVVLMVIAAPIAYALSYYRFAGKSFLEALIYLPMALPPTVIGFLSDYHHGTERLYRQDLADAYRRVVCFLRLSE